MVEDHHHLIQCTHTEMIQQYKPMVEKIDNWLQDNASPPTDIVRGAIVEKEIKGIERGKEIKGIERDKEMMGEREGDY